MAVPVETDDTAGLIFSSANGVNSAAMLDVDRTLPAYCIGPATSDAAIAAGWNAQMAGLTAEELITNLTHTPPPGPLLHLRGEHSRGGIAEHLTRSGLLTREQPVYRQQLLPLSDEASLAGESDRPVIAPLFSPRTARQFADVWAGTAPLWLIAISAPTAEPLNSLASEQLKIASEPTPDKMQKAVKKLVKHVMRVEGKSGAD
ncbi:uroporphyrinogen-III synthase [Ruegeria halocynthiae]|uniref:Uroporphyrinogen-III synthase n=2 Tax=Ruegeria halocynthiae TaxID=985054 RepID=A0A1H3BJE2_9RHOB|nr:uroporphyrinogen-III synthase [Ruegeria halocynthiae]